MGGGFWRKEAIFLLLRSPHKGSRHFPTVPDMSDMSDYVGFCRILSDSDVGICQMPGTFVGALLFDGFLLVSQ